MTTHTVVKVIRTFLDKFIFVIERKKNIYCIVLFCNRGCHKNYKCHKNTYHLSYNMIYIYEMKLY
jgi:hypothetical protein